MLELKMSEIVKAIPVVQKLKEIKDITIATAYEIRKLVKVVTEKTQAFEEARVATVTALGTKQVGNDKVLLDEKFPEFQAQMDELLQKVEKLDIEKIPFAAIKDSKGLTAGDLELLDAFIAY